MFFMDSLESKIEYNQENSRINSMAPLANSIVLALQCPEICKASVVV